MTTVYTVGHGTRGLDELVGMLRAAGVEVLADVRRFPGSRRNPQHSQQSLEAGLRGAGIDYVWLGEGLGGRRSGRGGPTRHTALRNASFRSYADHMDTTRFRRALRDLEELARARTVAVMCAESVWWRCHRRHIADALVVDGFRVVHLLGPGRSEPHRLHPAMRVDPYGRPVYDVGGTGSLPV